MKNYFKSCVLTIGNFDGLHVGHQKLIAELNKIAKQLNLPSVLMTFEPQPNEFFSREQPINRLMRFREKWLSLLDSGLDYLVCFRFDEKFSAITAEEFVKDILVKKMGVKAVIVGDDFRFGAKRAGDFSLLKRMGAELKFSVIQMPTLTDEGERISSTRIRKALQMGDLDSATKILGKPFSVSGKVIHGDARGRDLGFPTANIYLHRRVLPLSGIFAVKIYGIHEQPLLGAANVGTRPTFDGQQVQLEVYIFDFNQDVYDKHLTVEFWHKIRDEVKYDAVEDLIQQMHQDVAQIKQYFRGDDDTRAE